jgi:hypothetical protein
MNTDPIPAPDFLREDQRSVRFTPETKVTLDLSGIPAKAQQAISAWLSEKDQQAIVDALAAMARRVDAELHGSTADGSEFAADATSEIMVIPSLKADSFRLFAPTETGRKAA